MSRKRLKEDIRLLLIDFLEPSIAAKINETDIFGSGKIEGDDADEFLDAFIERFGVDMSTFEPWFHYIADEPPSSFGRRIVPIDPAGRVIPVQPVSLDDLVEAAEKGRWVYPYPAFRYRSQFWKQMLQYLLIIAIALWIIASMFL